MPSEEIIDDNAQELPSNVVEPKLHNDPSSQKAGLEDDAPEEKPAKPLSRQDALKEAYRQVTKEDGGKEEGKPEEETAKAAPKAKEEAPKVETAKVENEESDTEAKAKDVEKSAASAGNERDGDRDKRQSEGRQFQEPPARFLPKSREVWANVPNAVKADFHRISQEMEQETAQYKQSHEAYEQVKEFDEMAKQSGTNLKTALTAYVGLEKLLRADPVRGIAEVLKNVGLTPQQYAQHVMQNPQAHVAQAPQQQQRDPEVAQMKQMLEQMTQRQAEDEARRREEEINNQVIRPFQESHPRFQELELPITNILKSGVIELQYGKNLSYADRLEIAYAMAEGINPSSSKPIQQRSVEPDEEAKPVNLAGTKSVKSAPGAIDEDSHPNGRKVSRRDAVLRAAAQIGF